ncbi:MAG TPA: hypothetical protein VOA88_11010 [Candidatus Dormibacteraeota bacterium]|nr:hypothetical protein [Candidatus Dormibacteraeota bacterium]
MLILRGTLFGMALFLIGSLIYMLAAPRLIRAPGVGIISTNSPYLWQAFAGSLAVGYFISDRRLWIFQGVLLGIVMFMLGVAVYWIAYTRSLNLLPQPPGVAIGINITNLLPWLIVALISSVGLGLAIVRVWPSKRIFIP